MSLLESVVKFCCTNCIDDDYSGIILLRKFKVAEGHSTWKVCESCKDDEAFTGVFNGRSFLLSEEVFKN